eukprot:scaffold554_cov297-Ochromonas_danica.AAC.2
MEAWVKNCSANEEEVDGQMMDFLASSSAGDGETSSTDTIVVDDPVEEAELMVLCEDIVDEPVPAAGLSHLSLIEKATILQKYGEGMSFCEIGQLLRRHHSTIARFYQKWEKDKTLTSASGRGRPRKTDERTDRAILNYVRQNRFITSKQIADLPSFAGLSERLIRRRISESGDSS